MPGTLLNSLPASSHIIPTTTHRDWYYHYRPLCRRGNWGTEGMSHVPGSQLCMNHGGNSQSQEGAASRAKWNAGRQQAESSVLYKCEKLPFTSPRATGAMGRMLKGPRGQRWSSSGELSLSGSAWLRGTAQVKKGLPPTRDFLKHSLGRVFAESVLWSDNNLTPTLPFSAGTRPSPWLFITHRLSVWPGRNSG